MSKFIRSLDDIVGHKNVISYLKTKVLQDTVPNVILFNGNAGLGKTSIAKVLAIEVNGGKPEHYKAVIDKNESVDCIKLFNMSSLGDDTDRVVSELQSVSFSSTKRKVLILDEVHGMTKKMQDALLVTLEYLPKGIYVFMCTTEMSMLRESLISRTTTFNLNNLTVNEIKQVIKRKIIERNLTFEMSEDMVLNIIASWSNNQPRKAINLLESFMQGEHVTQNMLSAFVPTNNIPIVISLIDYLYGSLTNGLEFIDTLSITNDLLLSLLEALKVAMGHSSGMVSKTDTATIRSMFAKYDINNFIKFTIRVNSQERISKRVFMAAFLENHFSIVQQGKADLSVSTTNRNVREYDLRTIGDNSLASIHGDYVAANESGISYDMESALEELFKGGQLLIDGVDK